VTAAHVEAEDDALVHEGDASDTIAAVHSHVGMSVFFSGEDKKHMNHTIEFIVNRDAKLACSVRTTLECGRPTRVEAPEGVAITLIGSNDQHALVETLKQALTEEKPIALPASSTTTTTTTTTPAVQANGTCSCDCAMCKSGHHGCSFHSCRIPWQSFNQLEGMPMD